MPILVTIATVTYLFSKGSKGEAGFLAPAVLREKIEKLPEGSDRTKALGVADRLDTLAREYDSATDAAMSAYITDVKDRNSSADMLIEDMEPIDRVRGNTLSEVVRLREDLVDALSPEEWDEVFG
jgi:hypothetical protein